jgi:nucleotide-binding universal stress UspA family protein
MKTIVVPTDFSPNSINAAFFATEMAAAQSLQILLFNVYQIPMAYAEVPLMLQSVDDLLSASMSQLEKLKNKITVQTGEKVKVETRAVMGNLVDELKKLCDEIHPFAVVMGAKGISAFEKIVFGSNTLLAVRHLISPVIAVPEDSTYGKGIQKIGFACDFTDTAHTVPVKLIREFVNTFHAELHVINVDYNEKHFSPATPTESLVLHELLQDLSPTYHYIENKNIEDGIREFAAAQNLDLVIAIPKKHKLLEGIFKSSSTRQLIFESGLPVMCIHE